MIYTEKRVMSLVERIEHRIIPAFHPTPTEACIAFKNSLPILIRALQTYKKLQVFQNQFPLEIIRRRLTHIIQIIRDLQISLGLYGIDPGIKILIKPQVISNP